MSRLARALRRRAGRSRPVLEFSLGDRRLSFNTVADFDFCLASKTQLPAARLPGLMSRPIRELEAQLADLRDTAQRLEDLATCAKREGGGVDEVLRTLDPQVFSHDHDWRAIMQSLRGAGSGLDRFQALALARYGDYLATRALVLEDLCRQRSADRAEAEESPDPALRETAAFDLVRMDLAACHLGALRRLPRGVAITVRLPASGEVELMLSRHRFALLGGPYWSLRDEAGREHALVSGSGIVGRLRTCDTVLDPDCRAVSRKHLLVEPLSHDRARLTDLSSHGTFVTAASIVEALPSP